MGSMNIAYFVQTRQTQLLSHHFVGCEIKAGLRQAYPAAFCKQGEGDCMVGNLGYLT